VQLSVWPELGRKPKYAFPFNKDVIFHNYVKLGGSEQLTAYYPASIKVDTIGRPKYSRMPIFCVSLSSYTSSTVLSLYVYIPHKEPDRKQRNVSIVDNAEWS